MDDYEKGLAQARELVSRIEARAWEIARLTYEVVSTGEATIEMWATDTDMPLSEAETAYKMWERYGTRYLAGKLGNVAYLELALSVDEEAG